MSVDHILPRSQGGVTLYKNLCFAYRRCNEFKGSQTTTIDPLSGESVPLFHPRQDSWNEHFIWDESGVLIVGSTAIGRATILALNMNNPLIVAARHRWVSVGWHPPKEYRYPK
jgi:5-methylcytosine-specific restriction endonuclease McrA